ncbi:MAG: valine--tRNA ligase, partial [Patescibacteria group bacterium]|nr:valine--tRNA ligase [Patescibacteria group bacterium]
FTMDKEYQQAVQQAFLHYFEKGWIYQGERVINWCPRCATSLSDLELEYKEEKGKLYFIKYKISGQGETTNGYRGQTATSTWRSDLGKGEFTTGRSVLETTGRSVLEEEGAIVVATTRPETMLGDTAVAVNPKDKRYKNLVGKKVILPLVNKEIPIIADRLIDIEFGTGAVKITPAHSLQDQEIGAKHKLEAIKVIGKRGEITDNAPMSYRGLKIIQAREKIVEDLQNQGMIEKIEDYAHQIPKCYRCNSTVELIPSLQWFLKMKELAKIAEEPVKKGKITFHPKNFEKPYFDWLKNIKDWCISRQIWWGHRLPVWQCQEAMNNEQRIANSEQETNGYRDQTATSTWRSDLGREEFTTGRPDLEERGRTSNVEQGYFVSSEKPKKCPICGKCKPKQVNDVLDTWFSSALWPFATLKWPNKKPDNKKVKTKSDLETFYPTNVLSTARDIVNLWVTRMIFSGQEFMGQIPFKDVYIHSTILTKDGKRMSKSLGTGIDPISLIEKYGADATRFGIAYQIMGGQDIKFSEDNIAMGKKFCNKVWNASRFVLGQTSKSNLKSQISNLEIKNLKLTTADRKILKQLDKTIKSVNKDLENFLFGKATHTLYDFFWHDYCDTYIEASKKQNDKQKKNTEKVLIYVLLDFLKLLHPFAPFITEEIYNKLPLKNKEKYLMIEKWPE